MIWHRGHICLEALTSLHTANLGETLWTIGWDTPVHMAGQFGPWGRTVRYLGPSPKCLLDTSVLVPKCPDTSDPAEQCRSVSVPNCVGSKVSRYLSSPPPQGGEVGAAPLAARLRDFCSCFP